MEVTRILADFVTSTDYSGIPVRAREIAKDAIMDSLGVALAGARDDTGRIIVEHVRSLGGKAESGVIAGGFRTSPPQAALANGIMIHALDYDDVAPGLLFHPSAPLLPTILALGEKYQVPGEKVIEAYVIGVEVETQVCRGLGAKHYAVGWHITSTASVFGAVAGAARVLGLSSQQVRRAFGIAASQASGLRQNFGSMTKPFHAGNAARGGVTAAMLAQQGFTADENILESRFGFLPVFGYGEAVPEKIVEGLGNPFKIVSVPGLGLKPYPTCGETHRCIGAMLNLITRYNIGADDVVEVVCRTSDRVPEVVIHSRPKTALEGKFSMEFCMAVALVDGEVGLKQVTDEKVNDPRVKAIIPKVKYYHPESMSGLKGLLYVPPPGMSREQWEREVPPEAVTVKLKDGREYTAEMRVPKGRDKNPMTTEDKQKKYRDCASLILGSGKVEKSLTMLSKLEEVKDIRKLMDIVCFPGTLIA